MLLRPTNIVIDEIEKIKKGRLAVDEEIKQIEASDGPRGAAKYKYNLDRIFDRREIDIRNKCNHPLFIKEVAQDTNYNCRCLACEDSFESNSMLDYEYYTNNTPLLPTSDRRGLIRHTCGGPVLLYPKGINKNEYYSKVRNNFVNFMTAHINDPINDHLLVGIFIQEYGYKEDKSVEEAYKQLANQDIDDINNAIESIQFIKKLQLKTK